MIVVAITELNKQRSRILLETEESFVLYKGEIRMLKIKEGTDLSTDDYEKIMKGILPKRCKMRALNLLKERRYTSYTLKKKLLEGGYPDEVADETLAYVSSYGYVDDLEYAKDYIAEFETSKTKAEIRQKLLTKGISVKLCDEAYKALGEEREQYEEPGEDSIQKELILKTLKKKGYSSDISYEEKQKILAYFYRRGFEIDAVRSVMESIDSDEE